MRLHGIQPLLLAVLVSCPAQSHAAQKESGPAVPCEQPVPALSSGVFNLGDGPVRLKDGKACAKLRSDDPGCEWTVQLAETQAWGVDDQFLMVVINRTHATGNGA